MPAGFERCVREGGRVRTIKPKGQGSKTYIHVCWLNGKSYQGEVKKAKAKSKSKGRSTKSTNMNKWYK